MKWVRLSACRAKKATRREWDKRWGRPDREGNIWWLGSSRANWEMVFGKAKLGWFCEYLVRRDQIRVKRTKRKISLGRKFR